MTPQQPFETGEGAWLSPTSAAKLLACPASVEKLPRGPERPTPPTTFPRNAGTLAHIAVQRWIESASWRDDSECAMLATFFREEAAKHGVTIELLPDGRTTEARLEVQGSALANALGALMGGDGTVEAEVSLYDDHEYLWGTIDVLVSNGVDIAVLDLKTGEDAAGSELPDHIQNQLRHYGLLVSAARQIVPKSLLIFSLRRGLRPVGINGADLVELRSQLNSKRQEWLSGLRTPNPSQESCTFCQRRLYCEPHWIELKRWERKDAVEGVLQRVDHAANGLAALMLSIEGCTAWISNVTGPAARSLVIGAKVRAVRVRRELQDEESEGIDRWRASEQSAFSSL